MVAHNYAASESEQMYLISVAQRIEDGFEGPAPITALAEALHVQPVSVNQMARKMEDAGLLVYQPYKGVELTEMGRQIADRILRYRRLWEVFLVQHLGMSVEEATVEACNMEHDTSEELADRLDAFLGMPSVGPEGKPIYRSGTDAHRPRLVALTELSVGQQAVLGNCSVSDAVCAFLAAQGIRPGATLRLAAAAEDSFLVQVKERFVSVARSLAEGMRVELAVQKGNQNHSEPVVPDESKEKSGMLSKTEQRQLVPLNQLKVGQRGVVVRIGGRGPARRRMLDMGLVPGAEIRVVRVAPLGDPVEFELMGYSLSLRKNEAGEITVELLPGMGK